jgi:LPS export ABC transporter protein LptC
MRRTQLRAALLVVVAAALGGIGYLVSRSIGAHREDLLRELGADLLPQVAQRIRNFRRVKVENGRTVWEITAADAQLFDETHEVVVREPRVTFFLEDGDRECRISGAEGRLNLDGRELVALTLRGGVAVRLDDLVLTTEEATYDRERDLITSSADVTIQSESLELQGRGMEISVGPQHMRLLGDVRTVVRPHAAAS